MSKTISSRSKQNPNASSHKSNTMGIFTFEELRNALMENNRAAIVDSFIHRYRSIFGFDDTKENPFSIIIKYLKQEHIASIKGCFYMLQLFDLILSDVDDYVSYFFDSYELMSEMAKVLANLTRSPSIHSYKLSHVVECYWRLYESSLAEGTFVFVLYREARLYI